MLISDYSIGRRFVKESFNKNNVRFYLGATHHPTLERLWAGDDVIGFIRKFRKEKVNIHGDCESVKYFTRTGTIIAEEYDKDKPVKKLLLW